MPRSIDDLYEESLPDSLPINVMPASNEEFVLLRRRGNRSRFRRSRWRKRSPGALPRHDAAPLLQKSAAYAITMTAINQVMGRNGGYYANAYDGTCNRCCTTRSEPSSRSTTRMRNSRRCP